MTKLYPDHVEKDFSARKPMQADTDLVIAQRYSTRAFKREELDEKDVLTLFDAARQAPSCFNEQPWKFYASSTESFDQFLTFLVPDNLAWAKQSSMIFVITAQKVFDKNGKQNEYRTFDCGAAWFAIAYQARTMGLYTHAMAGINKERIVEQLDIPDTHEVVCAVAVGVIDEEKGEQEEITSRKALNDILEIR